MHPDILSTGLVTIFPSQCLNSLITYFVVVLQCDIWDVNSSSHHSCLLHFAGALMMNLHTTTNAFFWASNRREIN